MNVTRKISIITQPWGGYLPVSSFTKVQFADEDRELISHTSGSISEAADYLSRYLYGDVPIHEAFKIPLVGAELINDKRNAVRILNMIKDTDDASLRAALRLVCYDSAYRIGASKDAVRSFIQSTSTSPSSCNALRKILARQETFFTTFGKITMSA